MIMSWLLKLLGALITAGIVASVGLQWQASQAIERIEAGMAGLRAADVRQERAIERLNAKLDAHERRANGAGT